LDSENKLAVRLLLLSLLSAFALARPLAGQAPADAAVLPGKPVAELRTRDAIILGSIVGLLEYLPVSSLGHTMVADHFLGLENATQLRDDRGRLLWVRPPQPLKPLGEPLSLKSAADTFTVVAQIGAILAVGILFRQRFAELIRGILGQSEDGRRLLFNLVVAFLPAAIVGFILNRWILEHLFTLGTFISAQLVGAALMFYAEWWRKQRPAAGPGLDGVHLPLKSALGIGVLQCASFWPGMSRSMTTIVGGYFSGMDGPRSGEFSFLLGFFTLSAAAIYKARQSGPAMVEVFGWSHVLLGCAVATVSAMLAVKLFLSYLTRHGLTIFAIYRVAFALVWGLWIYSSAG
jgi:undecaprenyl-diphosphatase